MTTSISYTRRRRTSRGSTPKNALDPALYKKLIAQGKLPDEPLPQKKRATLNAKDFADILNKSMVTVIADLPNEITFSWEGARLMTHNQQLHAGSYVRLLPYKKACHAITRNAILLTPALKGFQFSSKVEITLLRTAKRLVDEDGLSGMFKFLIDGFAKIGLIIDDDPRYVKTHSQQKKGDYCIEMTFRILR